MDKKLKPRDIIILVAIVLLVVLVLFCAVRIIEGVLRKPAVPQSDPPSKTIIRDGVSYYPRQDIVTILVAGIDQTGPVQDSGTYNNSGEADMVALVILDQKTETVDVVALNRDTMLDMPILGIGGKEAGTFHGQLALAHTYGSGLEDSAENLKTTVSNFLYGVNIDYYMTMNMDAIALLNDAVGGVTVTVEEDFSAVTPSLPMGQVTLNGEQALAFLRSRQGVGDQLNLSRMERQEAYITAFVGQLRNKLDEDSTFATTVYNQMAPYMVTDVSGNALLGLVRFYSDFSMGQIYSVQGENEVGKFMEYHVDAAALDKLILQLLYAPKK